MTDPEESYLARALRESNYPGVFSRLIRDEISRQSVQMERRLRAYPGHTWDVEVKHMSQEDADIRERTAMTVYGAVRDGAKHDLDFARRHASMQRLNKQLEMMAKLDGRSPNVETGSTRSGVLHERTKGSPAKEQKDTLH